MRATAAEQAACGSAADVSGAELWHVAMAEAIEVPFDVHGSASFRRWVGAAMVERAWREAIAEATSG